MAVVPFLSAVDTLPKGLIVTKGAAGQMITLNARWLLVGLLCLTLAADFCVAKSRQSDHETQS